MVSGPAKAKSRRIDWSKVNWTLRNVELADLLGVSQSSVRHHRLKLGAPQSPMRWKKRDAISFAGVDWSKPNSVIAAEFGVSNTRVQQVRAALGKPGSPFHHQRAATLKDLDWMKRNAARLKGKGWAEVYDLLGRKGQLPVCKGMLYEYWKRHLAPPLTATQRRQAKRAEERKEGRYFGRFASRL